LTPSVNIIHMTTLPKPLTKSRFKMARECPTRLYYAAKPEDYFDANQDNDFLQSLADGGYQVGELAKYLYHDDPIGAGITIESLNYEVALEETSRQMAGSQRTVIAEAAIAFKNFFIRVDILIHDPITKTLQLVEVKSSSVDEEVVVKRFKNRRGEFEAGWLPYLYDAAFQAQVAKLAFPEYQIETTLVLLDSKSKCDIDGLHQRFQVVEELDPYTKRKRSRIKTEPGTVRSLLGNLEILRDIDITDVVDELSQKPIDIALLPQEATGGLLPFMHWASEVQRSGEKWFGTVSKVCKLCPYRAGTSEAKKSGVHECWQIAIDKALLNRSGGAVDRDTPLSIDLWGGGGGATSIAQTVLDKKRAYVADVQSEDLPPKKSSDALPGMTANQRRMSQVAAARSGNNLHLNVGALKVMDEWAWPLHMIDFETSAPAVPFFAGMRPYETLAFQFSHHVMERDSLGKIHVRHANQWISTAANTFPSIEFVRRLKKALMPDELLEGTVFRYHNHENTVLRNLRGLIRGQSQWHAPDTAELIAFIDLITRSTGAEGSGEHEGERQMFDLHGLIQKGYYSGHAGGSISLKKILPAILRDAPGVAELYSKPGVYGKGLEIASLNFEGPQGHVWLQRECGYDPYQTLPPIFGPGHVELNQMLGKHAGDEESGSIKEGGLAMTVYNYTQFSCLEEQEREAISSALLRYCELDTLAMVMLVQGLTELRYCHA